MPQVDPRFERPPVRRVALTVYFKPLEELTVSHLSSFREEMRSAYPSAEELPPIPPPFTDSDESNFLTVPQGKWPLPYVSLSNAETKNGIALQSDRIIRIWSFKDGTAYPGFDALSKDLDHTFRSFASVVQNELQVIVEPTAAECFYLNDIEASLAPPEALAVGVLTKWTMPGEVPSLEASYAGLRIHLHRDDEEGSFCSVTIGVDRHTDEVATLTLQSVRRLEDDEKLELGGLKVAHDELIKCFLEFTNDKMRESWGLIK